MTEYPEVKLERKLTEDEKKILRAYVDWVDAGAPDHKPFVRSLGLCTELGLTRLFTQVYPFNTEKSFNNESYTRTKHLNPARIAWARANAAPKETDND